MTWSVIAHDRESGLIGLAIASRFFAVGALCPWTEARVGAVSTQAMLNPLLGKIGLDWLRAGFHAADVCQMLIAGDAGRASRQVHVMDAGGATAAHTGPDCVPWCGHIAEPGLSVAGNMLAGEAVVADTLKTFKAQAGTPLVERLLAAMEAGEAAGGDKRGKQSAAIVIQGPDAYPALSLRADDHPDPLAELRRLYGVSRERFIAYSLSFPTPGNAAGLSDRAMADEVIARHLGLHLEAAAATRAAACGKGGDSGR